MAIDQAPLEAHHGIDYTRRLNLDILGVFYIAFGVVYTLIVCSGLVSLWYIRKTQAVRIRSFVVTTGTVVFLHVYLLLILLVYPLNGRFTCKWEFWIMSILLPLGIALFQASNIRLHSYAKEQKSFEKEHVERERMILSHCWSWKTPQPIKWIRYASVERRTYAGICVGIILQFFIALTLFLGSRKFDHSFGFFSQKVPAGDCRRGAEWIPSVFWQFLWSTVFGPYVWLRIRKINDNHFWAWQTRLAVIACLPGTPLWLLFVYAPTPAMEAMNRFFPPSGWFLPGLFTIQFVSIFFPLLDHYQLKQRERKHKQEFRIEPSAGEKPINAGSMYMFETQLEKTPNSLLSWASTKEFTAENIIFLMQVNNFKKRWEQVAKHNETLSELQLRERYDEAALIFFTLVNPHTARMNINVDHKTYRELEEMFKGCNYEAFSDDGSSCSKGSSAYTENIVTPWDDQPVEAERPASSTSRQSNDSKGIADSEVDKLYQIPVTEISAKNTEAEDVIVPSNFSPEVFDRAFEIVKNDVYLNTWVRFDMEWGRPLSETTRRKMSYVSKV